MTQAAIAGPPRMHAHGLPVIEPRSLSPGQRRGRRCAVPNCRRLLSDLVAQIGCLPGGKPVLACVDCAHAVGYAAA